MKIVAKFIGTNSLGYENGKEYGLIIKGLQITRLDGTGACPYGSIESFFNNWIIVSDEIESRRPDLKFNGDFTEDGEKLFSTTLRQK